MDTSCGRGVGGKRCAEISAYLLSSERQEVTGLIVNKKANIWRKDISLLRMKLHSARVHGPDKAAKLWLKTTEDPERFWQHIEGWLSYVSQVRGLDDPVTAKLCKMAVLSGLKGSEWIERYADMVREFDVFLSHASEDKPKVRKLKEKLEEYGVKVFFDESSISRRAPNVHHLLRYNISHKFHYGTKLLILLNNRPDDVSR